MLAGEVGEPVARRDFCLDEAQRDRHRRDSNATGNGSHSFLALVFNIRQSSITAPAGANTILSFSERKQSIFFACNAVYPSMKHASRRAAQVILFVGLEGMSYETAARSSASRSEQCARACRVGAIRFAG